MDGITVTKFLSAFFSNEEKIVLLAAYQNNGEMGNFYPTNLNEIQKNKSLQDALKEQNQTKDVYFCVHSGGMHDDEITRYNTFFVETGKASVGEQLYMLDNAPYQPSIKVQNKVSIQAYWLIEGNCCHEEWNDIQFRLMAYFDGDRKNKKHLRFLRVPHFNQVTYGGRSHIHKKVEVVSFDPSQRFTVEQMKNAFASPEICAENQDYTDITAKQISSSLNSYKLIEAIKVGDTVKKPDSLNPLKHNKDQQKEFGSPMVNASVALPPESKCFYGLAGDIVKTVEPYTEADPMALLLNTLVAFGNAIGRKAFFEADGSKHYSNLFGVLVGSTSAGKGTSWSQIKRLFESVDNEWSRNQIQSGLSSGEGLIAAVKDDNNNPRDKRLLVVESEFSAVLSMNKREGNTLSPIIRGFWDEGSAQTMTKVDPISVNDAHISIIGHITPDELKACLGKTEIANGFVNRFLWLQIKRSKSLPEGGKVPTEQINALVEKLSEAIKFSQSVEEIERDEEARMLWRKTYSRLTAEKTGAFGNATARARAQVARLSIIYALMNKSNVVRGEHLEAALDFWNYCEKSARKIFGESTGNKLADDIYSHLKTSKKGMSKTDIHKMTNKNYSSKQLDDALLILSVNGLAHSIDEKRDGGSKHVEVWYADEFNEFNELNDSSNKRVAQNDLGMPA